MRLAVMRRPGGLGHPASGQRLVVRRRPMARGHPGAQHRLVHDARRLALQPMVPPAQHLLQEADLRAGLGEVRIGVRPRPDQALARHVETFQQARDGVGVAIGPAADGEDRTLDRAEILAHRAVPPVGVAPLVLQPALEEQRHVLQPLQPHLAPALADQQRDRADGTCRRRRSRPSRGRPRRAWRRPCSARRRRSDRRSSTASRWP